MCAENLAQSLVEKVSSCVVCLACMTTVNIYTCHERCVRVSRHLLNDMYWKVVLLLCVDNLDCLVCTAKNAAVANLTTHLGVERSLVENNLEECLLLLSYLTVAQNVTFVFSIVVSNEFSFAFFQSNPVASLYRCCVAGALLLLLHLGIERVFVNGHSVLAADKFCKVEREAECIEQSKCLNTVNLGLASLLCIADNAVEQLDTSLKSTKE